MVRDFKESLGGATLAGKLRLIDRETFLVHRDWLLGLGCSPSTVNHTFKTLVDIFGAAHREGLLPSNPAVLKSLKADKSDRKPFSPEQIRALLAVAEGDMFGLVLLGAFTGQRLMDIATLSWKQVDLSGGIIRFHQRKGDKPLVMPIHPQVADFLLARAGDDPNASILPELAKKKGSGSCGLSMMFSRLMDAARIAAPVVRERSGARGRTTRELSFHSLRHSFNSMLANGSVSQELRQRLTGHTTAAMNDVYTSIELSTLRRAVESLPPIPVTSA